MVFLQGPSQVFAPEPIPVIPLHLECTDLEAENQTRLHAKGVRLRRSVDDEVLEPRSRVLAEIPGPCCDTDDDQAFRSGRLLSMGENAVAEKKKRST